MKKKTIKYCPLCGVRWKPKSKLRNNICGSCGKKVVLDNLRERPFMYPSWTPSLNYRFDSYRQLRRR